MGVNSLRGHELNRRALLRSAGLIAGAAVLSPLAGCTQSLFNSTEQQQHVSKQTKASKKLDKSLAQETKLKWKEVFLSQKDEGDKILIPKDKFDAAVSSLQMLVAHCHDIGMDQEVDSQLAQADLSDSKKYDLDEILRELEQMATPKEYIEALRNGWLQGDREKARRHVLDEGGSYRHMQGVVQTLKDFSKNHSSAESSAMGALSLPSGGFTLELDKCNPLGPIVCAVAFAAAALVCSDEETCGAFLLAIFVCTLALAFNCS